MAKKEEEKRQKAIKDAEATRLQRQRNQEELEKLKKKEAGMKKRKNLRQKQTKIFEYIDLKYKT